MFLEHGSFQALELAIVKRNKKTHSRSKQGGWFTRAKLEKNEGYTKTLNCVCIRSCFSLDPAQHTPAQTHAQLRNMLAKAWAWAQSQGKLRVNEVHGEEEIYIVSSETFDITAMASEEATQSGAMSVQAHVFCIECYLYRCEIHAHVHDTSPCIATG